MISVVLFAISLASVIIFQVRDIKRHVVLVLAYFMTFFLQSPTRTENRHVMVQLSVAGNDEHEEICFSHSINHSFCSYTDGDISATQFVSYQKDIQPSPS